MFRQPYLKIFWLVALIFPLCLSAQTIVSTTPTNKNAVLEEFGGMYCVYCPDGHQVLSELEEALDDRLVTINYHTGPYAFPIGDDPDLGNDYSDDLEYMAYVTGYPAATINRHSFPGLEQVGMPGYTAVGRADWAEAVTGIIQEQAVVNIAATAELDITSRELEIYIEYYYTGDAANNFNRLHIGVMQNNVLAPQHGGNAGDYYLHKYLFREYITGQNGQPISNTEEGGFGSFTYNVTIPEYYRDVWMDLVNLELAIFITENQEEVLQGIQVSPNLITSEPVDANLLSVIGDSDICGDQFSAQINMRNDGFHTLESCTIRYGVEGDSSNEITWTGALESLTAMTIDLPPLQVLSETYHNDFYVELLDPNYGSDPTEYNNFRTHSFTQAPIIESAMIEMAIKTDVFGYELYWEIVDAAGVIHASGGNQVVAETNGGAQIAYDTDPGAYDDEVFIIEEVFLPMEGCYQLRVLDDYGDGICCSYGNGFYRLRIPGQTPFLQGGEFGALDEKYFSFGFGPTTTETQEVGGSSEPTLFPNPIGTDQSLAIQWSGIAPAFYNWRISNSNGQLLQIGNQNDAPDVSQLTAGYYFFQLQHADKQRVLPLVIHR